MTEHIRPDDDALIWEGAIEVAHTPDGSHPWRLPHSRIGLFPTEALWTRAAMCAGVRIVFDTDSTTVAGRAGVPVDPDLTAIDLVVGSRPTYSSRVDSGGRFRFSGLPAIRKTVELWLPQFGDFRLSDLVVDEGSHVRRSARPQRPRLLNAISTPWWRGSCATRPPT